MQEDFSTEQDTEQDTEQEKSEWLAGLDDGQVVDDDAYVLNSVPPSPDKYQLAAADKDHDRLEAPLLSSFQKFAHSQNIPQAEFAKVISFSLGNYSSESAAQDAFKEFCQKNSIPRERASKYVSFYLAEKKSRSKRVAVIQKRSGCDEGQARDIDTITRHPAFGQEFHKSHKAVMKRYFKALGVKESKKNELIY